MVRFYGNPNAYKYLTLGQQAQLGVVAALQEGHIAYRGGHFTEASPWHQMMNFVLNDGYAPGQEQVYPHTFLQYYPSVENAGDTYLLFRH